MEEGSLLSACAALRKLCMEEEDILLRVEQLVCHLKTEWQGEAEKTFIEKYLIVKDQYHSLIKELYQYEQILKDMVEDYRRTETKYASLIQTV